MEPSLLENVTISTALQDAHTRLDASSLLELVCALAIPLLAMLIGLHVNRFIDRRPHTTLGLKIIDFTAPLVSPLLAIAMCFGALMTFKYMETATHVLPFVLKLTVAWLAVRIVVLMSSRQSAGWLIVCIVIPITMLHLFGLWDITLETLSALSFSIGTVTLNVYLILKGIAAIFVLQWLASFSIRMVDNRLRRIRDMRASNRLLILKICQIALYCFVFVFGMQLLGISLTALSVFGGALGVGLGFGLQKIASNFISGIILLFEKSIEVGDLIELADGTTGFIRQTNARYTLLEAPDGREVLIPNEEFISQRVVTWTHSDKRARVEIIISVAYDSDMEQVRQLMIDAANAHPKRKNDREPICSLTAFGNSGVELRLYFWIIDVTDGRQEPRSEVMQAILKSFKAHGIVIPYPQQEVRFLNAAAPVPAAPEGPTA
ncbi:MAG: mechanosensitive ion channel domain-containing protein [Pseudomonadota bacterium]